MSKATESTVLHIPKDRCHYLVNAWPLLQSEVTEGRLINMTMELHQDGTGEVLLSTQKETPDVTDLSRCSQFIEAITLGFRFVDARKLLHRENVDLVSINIGRTSLHAISLKTKQAVEQRTSTSIAVDSPMVHIIGSSSAIIQALDLLPQLTVPR